MIVNQVLFKIDLLGTNSYLDCTNNIANPLQHTVFWDVIAQEIGHNTNQQSFADAT